MIDSEDTEDKSNKYVCSIKINGELSIRRKLQCKGLLLKKISKVILPLHVMTGCDVTSSFFGVDKLVWK